MTNIYSRRIRQIKKYIRLNANKGYQLLEVAEHVKLGPDYFFMLGKAIAYQEMEKLLECIEEGIFNIDEVDETPERSEDR